MEHRSSCKACCLPPCRAQWDNCDGCDKGGRLISPVVIDPYIGKHLRQHQVRAAGLD